MAFSILLDLYKVFSAYVCVCVRDSKWKSESEREISKDRKLNTSSQLAEKQQQSS